MRYVLARVDEGRGWEKRGERDLEGLLVGMVGLLWGIVKI